MTPRQKQQYAKQGQTGKTRTRDRIDILVDALDKYYFRIGSALNELSGITWIHEDCPGNIRGMFESERLKKRPRAILRSAKESGMVGELESAVLQWQADEDDFYTLLGIILGLRIAGIPSETAKAMARTWRWGIRKMIGKENAMSSVALKFESEFFAMVDKAGRDDFQPGKPTLIRLVNSIEDCLTCRYGLILMSAIRIRAAR